MKIIVIGCGSVGQRHIKNLSFLRAGEIFGFDIDKRKLKKIKDIAPLVTVSSDPGIIRKGNFAVFFITTPTALHVKYALEAAGQGAKIFIEKPLSLDLKNIDRLIKSIKRKKVISMVGCNMRFYWAIARIRRLLEKNTIGKIISARIEFGQYLPDWHPAEDYRSLYSAKKHLGGGIILDAIHEIDYALWLFGKVGNIVGIYGKLSSLRIETEDVAELLLKFKSGPIVSIHMDYIQRTYSRSCRIIGESGTIFWDFNEHCVKLYLAKKKKWLIFREPKGYKINDMYIEEAKYFLSCLKNKRDTFNNVADATKTLKVALAVKTHNYA